MIQVKKNPMLTFVLSAAFFLVSAPVFASQEDYHQRQNIIIDEQEKKTPDLNLNSSDSQKQHDSSSKKKSDEGMDGQSSSGMDNSGSSGMDKKSGN